MDGACFADKAAPEDLENAISLHQYSPERMGRVGIVGAVHLIHWKAKRILHLVRHLVYCDRDADAV